MPNLGLIVSFKNVKLGPINSLSSQLNDPHFMHGTKLVNFSLILSQGQRTKVVDKQISFCEISLIATCLFVTLILAAERWICWKFRSWSVWWRDEFLRIFTLAFLLFLAPVGPIF